MHRSRALQEACRTYLYDLSIHGALFLSTTPPARRATITSYRDPNFLRTFYSRLRRNEESLELRERGYEWVSHCQGESNFLRPARDGTPIVFDDLVNGELTYGAGSLSTPFSPAGLRVSPRTGYLFHPSPSTTTTTTTRRRSLTSSSSPYGPYSLVRSALVLEHFAATLDLSEREGGTYEYGGKRYTIDTLRDGDVWWRSDVE